MHTGLGILWSHVEPQTCSHRQITVLVYYLRLFQQVKLAIVGAGGKDVREHTIVVVPRELEWSTAVVLLAWSGGPGKQYYGRGPF